MDTPHGLEKGGGSQRIQPDRERQAPINLEAGEASEGKVEPSHFARYDFARKFVGKSDRVLDLPCGAGYGSGLIGKTAKEVIGVDVSDAAVGHAQEFFGGGNVAFVVGDAAHLPPGVLEKGSFDVAVSFEGIEHVPEPKKMLLEIKKVLSPGGKLIISTPRKPHGSPFHIIEFSREEFEAALQEAGFVIEEMYGQIYTDIFKMSDREGVDPHAYKRFNFIAVCHPA